MTLLTLLLATPLLAEAPPERGSGEGRLLLQEVPLKSAIGEEAPDGTRERRFRRAEDAGGEPRELELRVERIWSRDESTYASVRVRNTSPYELDEIRVTCSSFAQGERELALQEHTIERSAANRIAPGDVKTLELVLDRSGTAVRSVSCQARGY